jgi:hydrogenase-4 component F
VYGSVLHLINNALVKGLLFLAVGNVVLATGTATAASVGGLVRSLPASGLLLLVGLFAVTGSPPFGPFLSEFTILRAAMSGGHLWVAAVMLTLLVVIFVGMAAMILEMVYGQPPANQTMRRESGWLVAGPVALAFGVLALGIVIPGPLQTLLSLAASALGGAAP